MNSINFPIAFEYLNYFFHFTMQKKHWNSFKSFTKELSITSPELFADLEESLESFTPYEVEQAAIRLGEVSKERKPFIFDYMDALARQKSSFSFAVIDRALVSTRQKVDEVLGDASDVTKGVVFGLVVSSFLSLGLQLYRELKK